MACNRGLLNLPLPLIETYQINNKQNFNVTMILEGQYVCTYFSFYVEDHLDVKLKDTF